MRTSIEPATERILQTEGFRLNELLKAMFGEQVKIDLNITNVPQEKMEFLNEGEDIKTKSFNIGGLVINLENENHLPF